MAAPETAIVLVRPARAGNVAAACRAMKNMGLRDLRLVDPPPALLDPAERALAYGAFDVLDAARSFATLREAVADAAFVVATSGRRDLAALSPRGLGSEASHRAGRGRLAVVFGPERTGLVTEELQLCHAAVRIPADPAHGSLNLAQAVLVVAYELYVAGGHQGQQEAAEPPPSTGELEGLLDEAREALLAAGYLNPENPGAILSELRALLQRAAPTARERSLLRGLVRQVAWAGRVAGQRRRDA
jgi:TrmH family RNA methyltransferase